MPSETKTDDIQPLTEYRAHLADFHRHVQETNRPLFVCVNGRTSVVVLSPQAYDELSEKAMFAEDAVAIRQAHEDIKAGRGRSAEEALRDIASKLGLPIDR